MPKNINAVILAGGVARRLNGAEKGLQHWAGKPLIAHVVERLAPQVCKIHLNINRSHTAFNALFPDLAHFGDDLPDFQGPLSGMLSAFAHVEGENLLFVPCDSPFLPHNLAQKLYTALHINNAHIAYAHDGERPHPTFALINRAVINDLRAYLANGERRLLGFFQQQKSVAVDFSDQKHAFQNFNCPDDFCKIYPISNRLPPRLLGITGHSGTGKTTLLEKLIPELHKRGVQVGVIKHSHHNIDVDKEGKDSHRLRLAGANPTMIACEQRWALMTETPALADFNHLAHLFPETLDLILVEGFKHEMLPKIQLHRKACLKPLPDADSFTIATATDYPLLCKNPLDINNIAQIADFVEAFLAK